MKSGWIAVDLDGCLAEYHGWIDGHVGDPIMPMVERVKQWLTEGEDVRIFTARVGYNGPKVLTSEGEVCGIAFAEQQRVVIQEWCWKHLGQPLRVTATKDFEMKILWDDRAVSVEHNTGNVLTMGAA